jgi:hypothetical protein
LQALAASMQQRLYRILSQHGNNFIAGFTYAEATIEILAVFSWTSDQTFSLCGANFIAV